MTDFKCPHCGGEHPEGTETCPETGEEFTPALAQLGKIIGGKYEILKLLGEGGMGAVYEARHVEIRQHVALKLLHFQLARDQEIRQRFFREAMSAGEIGHENIIQMHDIGRDATGSIYLVMELLKGESLAERVRREGALPVDRAVDIMLQTLDALAASHAKGIVHRDMKPENVFLCRLGGRDDFVKILDFGIAKVKDPADGESLTRTGTMLGTAAYMAPEQIAGDREADHRMDVYACGVILYQMLSGRVPFDATSVHGVIYRIMNEDPPALSEMRQGLPAGVEEIVRRAIARNRDLRFQTAADFAQALVPFGSGRIVPGRGSRVPAAAAGGRGAGRPARRAGPLCGGPPCGGPAREALVPGLGRADPDPAPARRGARDRRGRGDRGPGPDIEDE
jgi:serine/threonine-protein kinase